jgi:hypothetical protein
MGATMHRVGQLDRTAEGFAFVVVDCPPRHGEIQRSALAAATMTWSSSRMPGRRGLARAAAITSALF